MKISARSFVTLPFLVAWIFSSSACTANKKPSQLETTLANAAKEVVISIAAKELKNPLPKTPAVISQGQAVYLQSCAICHGTDGRGHAALGQAMYPPAMDLTSPHVQQWKDAELFWIIQNGVRLTGMPAWNRSISADDTWKLVIFIQHLPEVKPIEEKKINREEAVATSQTQLLDYGKTLYRQEGCFTCHRLDCDGNNVGPDLTLEGTRGRTAQWLKGHFRDPATYVPGSIMPPFKNLTDDQVNALTLFLLSRKVEEKCK